MPLALSRGARLKLPESLLRQSPTDFSVVSATLVSATWN